MAADVRKDETDADIESCSIFSSSEATQLLDTSIESEYPVSELPSHAIVYQQMRDILRFQKAAAEQQIRSNNISLDASQRSLSNTLECQEKTIKELETSIQTDYISKPSFIEIEEKLKEERTKHRETLVDLTKTLDRLTKSQEEVADLTLQVEQEKSAFDKCCDSLRDDVQELKLKNRELKSVVTEKTQLCEDLKSQILTQKQEIHDLKNKHEKQKVKLKGKVSESELEKQQEAYMRQMAMEEDGKKKKKP